MLNIGVLKDNKCGFASQLHHSRHKIGHGSFGYMVARHATARECNLCQARVLAAHNSAIKVIPSAILVRPASGAGYSLSAPVAG